MGVKLMNDDEKTCWPHLPAMMHFTRKFHDAFYKIIIYATNSKYCSQEICWVALVISPAYRRTLETKVSVTDEWVMTLLIELS